MRRDVTACAGQAHSLGQICPQAVLIEDLSCPSCQPEKPLCRGQLDIDLAFAQGMGEIGLSTGITPISARRATPDNTQSSLSPGRSAEAEVAFARAKELGDPQ
jgi:hypothetical protein